MMITADNRNPWLVISLITLAMMVFAGSHFYYSAWKSLLNGATAVDALMVLGTGMAWPYSMSVNLWSQWFPMEARHLYYEASVMIIGLINLGHMLEARARQCSSKALEKLLGLTPPTARLVTDESGKSMSLAEVQPGILLHLTADDRVPVDGEITQGEAWLDEAILTGGPIPQQKGEGESVHTGTMVQDGNVLFRASTVDSHTTLSRTIRMVRQVQNSRPEIGQLAGKISAVFVPMVAVITPVSAAIWYSFGPAPQIVYTPVIATTVLIIARLCALRLATPMSVISGVGRTTEFGVLVRDADALQRANTLDIVAFGRTGTLTEGKPQVVIVKTFADVDEAQTLRLAAALEQDSSHPLARAILDKADDMQLPQVNGFRTLHRLGVGGEAEGHALLLGNQALLNEQWVDTEAIEAETTAQASQRATLVLLAVDGKAIALLTARDPLHSGSVVVLRRLHEAGYRLVMLAGDNPTTANATTKEAGIDEVIIRVLPDGKAETIKRLQSEGRQMAMVGDGINDAPTLAQANVGIAMGGSSDVAIETAAITLVRHSLMGVADALAIPHVMLRNMKQSLLGAFIYNSIDIPVATGILWPFTGTLLNPVVAGAAMTLSSITVMGNANRLLWFEPKE